MVSDQREDGQMLEIRHIVPAAVNAEADHRVANNLAMLTGLIRLQAAEARRGKSPLGPAEVSALLEERGAKVETVARLHRTLAAAGKSGIKIGDYVREICATVASLSAAARTSVSATYDCDQDMEAARALPVGFIVAEMMTNALKYAHPTGIPVRLRVSCTQANDASICIEVADDGVGLPERFDPSTDGGLGFRVMRSLAQQIGAELNFTTGPLGTTCRLMLKGRIEVSTSFTTQRSPATPQQTLR
jgi:two-component sensor histidine kinase